MERKAPLSPYSRNKNALKGPESGTLRAGNQLVRMRSQFPSLKDIEAGAAPARSLSNTRPDNIARDTENRRPPPAPCFFMFPSGPPRPRSSKPMPRRAYKRGNPHGANFPGLAQPIGGGLHRADPPLTPPCTHAPTRTHAPPVAGHPAADTQQTHFVNNKKTLVLPLILCYSKKYRGK